MGTLRTVETEAKYQAAIAAGLTKPLKDVNSLMEWKYWRLVRNDFPHDLILKQHDLLVPKRVFSSPMDMDLEESTELLWILFTGLEVSGKSYDSIKFNYPRQQSVKDHFHLHLMVNK